MRIGFLVLWVCSFAHFIFGAAGPEARVLLLNGDQVKGVYLGQDRETVMLDTGEQNGVLRIHGKYVKLVDFGYKSADTDADYRFQFSSGGFLRANLLEFSDGKMVLKTAWTDRLELDRGFLQQVEEIGKGKEVIFRGPRPTDHWEYSTLRRRNTYRPTKEIPLTSEGWTLNREGLLKTRFPIVNRGVGVRIYLELPEFSHGESVRLLLSGLPNDSAAGRGHSGGVELQIDQRSMKIIHNPQEIVRGMMLAQRRSVLAEVPGPGKGIVKLELDYDLQNQRFRWKRDDQILAEWHAEREGPLPPGYSPEFSVFWNLFGESITIGEVFLYLRNVPLPEKSTPFSENQESVLFQNGDSLNVKWEGVDTEGNWSLLIEDPGTRTVMNPDRIQLWRNQGRELKIKRRKSSHVEVKLAGGEERFLVELLGADTAALQVRREGWAGTYRIPLDQVEAVKFNPYFQIGSPRTDFVPKSQFP